jgi:hypothetical protein
MPNEYDKAMAAMEQMHDPFELRHVISTGWSREMETLYTILKGQTVQ